LFVLPVKHTHMSHPLHQLTRGSLRQTRKGRVARHAIAHAHTDFDELVIGECAIEFAQNAVRQPGVSQHHERMQRMGEAAQVFLLFLGQRHRRIVCRARA